MCCSDAQAAQRAIAEMQRIPLPSSPGADAEVGEVSEHGSASGSSAFTTDSQLQENGSMAGQQKQGMHLLLGGGGSPFMSQPVRAFSPCEKDIPHHASVLEQ